MRAPAILAILAAALTLSQTIPSSAPTSREYVAFGVAWEELTQSGGEIVNDYDGFLHVRLTDEQRRALQDGGVYIEALDFSVARGAYTLADDIPPDLRSLPSSHYTIVQFRGPLKAEWIVGIKALGGEPIEYLSNFAYLVRANAAEQQLVATLPQVRSVSPYHPAFKISPLLPKEGMFPATAFAEKGSDLQLLREQIQLTGTRIRDATTTSSRHVIDLTMTPIQVKQVAQIDDILWIERAMDVGSLDVNKSSAVTQSGLEGLYSINSMGITGSTQKVVVCDNGLDTFVDDSYAPRTVMWVVHSAFNETLSNPTTALIEYQAHLASPPLALPQHRKVLLYYSPVENGVTLGNHTAPSPTAGPQRSHGTRTAAIIAGDKPDFGAREALDGVAYAAKLFICDAAGETYSPLGHHFLFPNDAWNYLWPAWERGATVASFSFGANETGPAYTDAAYQMDEIVWHHRNLTIARAIGNSGTSAGQRPETIAKSVLSVGGTNNHPCDDACNSDGDPEKVATLSSRGPTADGRTKPNVVAGGFAVYAPSITTHNLQGGTSYAAPNVAGAATLIRDYLHKGYYPTGAPVTADERRENVSAALVRAMLMVSGKDLAAPGPIPNVNEGWGRPLLDNVLYFDNETNSTQKLLIKDEWESRKLRTGNSSVFSFRVNSGSEVRVFLAWSDYPGTLGAPRAIINDLDLQVGGPGCNAGILNDVCNGNAWIPGTNETASGKEHPHDRLNVEEAVYLCRPVAGACAVPTGNYTARVQGFQVATEGGQPYALVITGDVEWL